MSFILDDVIGGVLYFSKKTLFTGDPKVIHETFYELRDRYPLMQSLLAFTKNSVYPFSKQLEETLNTLQICRIIGMENPDFERYQIKSGGKKFIGKDIIPLFDKNQLKQIKEMAKVFDKKCGQKGRAFQS